MNEALKSAKSGKKILKILNGPSVSCRMLIQGALEVQEICFEFPKFRGVPFKLKAEEGSPTASL
jgi:hypothetical protein